MNNTKKMSFYWLIGGISLLLLTGFDQLTKYLASMKLQGTEGIDLIPGVFRLEYLENRGAAFGIFQNQQWMFILLCVIFIVAGLYCFYRTPKNKKYMPLSMIIIVLMAGAVGNCIDRVFYGYVVDFLYFSLIDFPIFNVADCYVTICTILLFYLIIFKYKEDDFGFLLKKEKE